MKEINVSTICESIKNACLPANCNLNDDVYNKLTKSHENETSLLGKSILKSIIENSKIARNLQIPMCQDTGVTCVFVEIGQEVHVSGGSLEDAINEGVRLGYAEGYLRKSVVEDPLNRVNTKDNTPAIINYKVVPGDTLKITIAPKGFGSENMSKLMMLKPYDGVSGVKKFVLETVKAAGSNPCPPIIVGIGIGGNFDRCAELAKKAAIRNIDIRNSNEFYKNLEDEILNEINELGIGPQGFGGKTTALAVNIEYFPTHIAGLPVAVNINCHAARHVDIVL